MRSNLWQSASFQPTFTKRWALHHTRPMLTIFDQSLKTLKLRLKPKPSFTLISCSRPYIMRPFFGESLILRYQKSLKLEKPWETKKLDLFLSPYKFCNVTFQAFGEICLRLMSAVLTLWPFSLPLLKPIKNSSRQICFLHQHGTTKSGLH